MADRVFCIDFGSAFTKVALRRDPGALSELLTVGVSGYEEADFCIPSTIAIDRRGTKPRVECGDRAADLRTGGGVKVYSNWKKWLFQEAAAAAAPPDVSPLEALLRSDELRDLATKYGVAGSQLYYLEQLAAAARGLIVGPTGRVTSAETQWQEFAANLAAHFFRWLREFVLTACSRLPSTGLKFEEIPVRIAVPAVAHPSGPAAHPGAKALLDALGKAGWPLHPDRPIVTEPYSNAIGILTNGTNAVRKGRLHLGEMFARGPFITVLKDPISYPSYRMMVIDIGAFSTDFAAVTLDTSGSTVEDPDGAITVNQESVPLGVSDLDARVKAALPKATTDELERLGSRDWDTFRRAVYSDGKPYRRPGLTIGGPSDAAPIRETLAEFARHVADEVVKFCGRIAPASRQELILTGGGCLVPAVREAVQQAAQANGHSYVKTHAPAIKKQTGGTPVHKLDERFTRGGSALGGASIYFEKDFYGS